MRAQKAFAKVPETGENDSKLTAQGIQQVTDVNSKLFAILKEVRFIGNISDLILEFHLQAGCPQGGKLGKITAGPAGIACLSRSFYPGFLIHVFRHAFVNGLVFINQIIVIFIIWIKIFQFTLIEVYGYGQVFSFRFHGDQGIGFGKSNGNGKAIFAGEP